MDCITQGTLLNVMWQPGWEGCLGENGYMYMDESLCCPSETVTTLLDGHTPIQNKSLIKELKKVKKSLKFILTCNSLRDYRNGHLMGSLAIYKRKFQLLLKASLHSYKRIRC